MDSLGFIISTSLTSGLDRTEILNQKKIKNEAFHWHVLDTILISCDLI
jgi:hypothetical protein